MATNYMGQGGYSVDWNQPGMFAPAGGSQPYAGQVGAGGWTPFMGDMSKSGTGTGVSYADMMARNPGLAGQAGSMAVPYSGGGFQANTANTSAPPGQTPWQMMGVDSPWNADGSAKTGGGMGGMATGAGMTQPGINWQDPSKQNAIRSAFNDPNNDPFKISQAMRDWGVSNADAMGAMGWDQGKFDNYFSPVFGNKGAPGPSGPGGPSGYGGYSGGGSGNPNLTGMADDIARRTQLGLGQAFNGIRSHAVGVGGLGGSRQGVAEGQAAGQAMDSLQGNLANLYGNQWNQDQNRGLQKYGMDQNYDINSQNTRNSFYLGNRGLDQSGARLGADLWNSGNNGEWDALKNASSVYSPYTGLGTTSQGGGGSNWQQILGGLLAGGSLGKQMGWWGN